MNSSNTGSDTWAFDGNAKWIWLGNDGARRCNHFVRFRRVIDAGSSPSRALLRVTADSRYEVYVNGEWLGHGPPRSWHSPWPVDEYDVRHLVRANGRNVIAVLVQEIGTSTFQYLDAPPGLLAQLDWADEAGEHRIVTGDGGWRAATDDTFAAPVPRISIQQAWEEQFDARREPDDGKWREIDFDDLDWPAAIATTPAGEGVHVRFELRDIPFLTRTPAPPVALLSVEAVSPASQIVSFDLRDLINDTDRSANWMRGRVLIGSTILSERAQQVELIPHGGIEWWVNGRPLKFARRDLRDVGGGPAVVRLHAGANSILGRHGERSLLAEGGFAMRASAPVRFEHWTALGPFDTDDLRPPPNSHDEWAHAIMADRVEPSATKARYEAIAAHGVMDDDDAHSLFARPLPEHAMHRANIFAACAGDRGVPGEAVRVEDPSALLSDDASWTTIYPSSSKDHDVRLLLDFGREVVGFHEFEIDAPAGTVVDDHNFEFIQRDGRYNFAEGMNNTFRYVCREGVQRYRTFVRRGFRYSFLTFRNFNRPVRLRFVRVLVATAPSAGRGNFECSDPILQQIWHVGAHTVRCCAEDTYTDCPTYEQTFWVGDARNEALVDLISSGDPRVSARCLTLAGRSLDRSPLVEALVPSGWQTILPAWIFLWMRWSHEHFLHTGDTALARRMIGFIERNVQGIESFINQDGLFDIHAWPLFDWAPMDVPPDGIVTHQNCLAVLGLRQAAGLARLLRRRDLTRRWDRLGDRISHAVNRHLWDEKRQAYIDSIHADGTRSPVFSQQTQTAAYISGVATGNRGRRCAAIIDRPPKGFVVAGSPFFMFFVLECYARQHRFDEMYDLIRRYWGGQIARGATTFWEEYHPDLPRQTRSHCHGWSAAPTFFLSQHVLGVQPMDPGYTRVRIAPQLGDLKWAQGRVPTPRGEVEIYWRRERDTFTLRVTVPRGTRATIEMPVRNGKLEVIGARARRVKLGTWEAIAAPMRPRTPSHPARPRRRRDSRLRICE